MKILGGLVFIPLLFLFDCKIIQIYTKRKQRIENENALDEEMGISGEVEVFGIWKDRKDIKSSIDWVRNKREKEWRRW